MARASSRTCTVPEPSIRGRNLRRSATALLVALSVGACSSQYQPQTGPRLSVVMDEGSLTYVRDGQRFKHGFMGGGLVEAVEDDPEAKEAAQKYQSRMTSGFVLYAVGTVCLLTGMIAGFSTIDDRGNHEGTDAVAAGGLLCGVAGLVTGASLLASGMPYQYDAVNLYNDNLEKRRWVMTPRPAPPGYVPYAPVLVPPGPPARAAPPPPPSAAPSAPDAGVPALDAGSSAP